MKEHDVIIKGVHLELTEALKQTVLKKVERLFQHNERIVRLRIELEFCNHKHKQNEFIAKGQIEIYGPEIFVSVASDDLYKSIDELVDKLGRQIRRKNRARKAKRKDTHDIDLSADLPKIKHAS